MYEKLKREVSIRGKGKSTLDNYSRHVAHLVLHYGCLPTEVDAEQLKDYLHFVKEQGRSRSFFKFTVYGLRMVFRSYGLDELRVALPPIKGEKRLPVVLSQGEMERLILAADMLKHKLMIALLYGCGLRNSELRALRLTHIDFDRSCIHVVQGKGYKDRVIPLCDMLIRGIRAYIASEHPRGYLFNGNTPQDEPVDVARQQSAQAVRWGLGRAVKKAGITKAVNVHTLRHECSA